jgi:hypothetical protein
LKTKHAFYRRNLGEDYAVFRVLENKTRNPPKDCWIGIFLRYLPLKIKKEDLVQAI